MEIYTIKNDKYRVSVKRTGAELCSFRSLHTDIEYIWKGDPDIWSGQAPNLFPVIGCLKEDSFFYKGKPYKCPKHGFIRNNKNIVLLNQTAENLTFGLKYDDKTLKIYPFKFEYQIGFSLEEDTLTVSHKVINHGDTEMLFSLGGHPGFTCPVHDYEQYTDYYLEFEKQEAAESWQVLKNGLIGKDTRPVFNTPKTIDLYPHIFDKDALVFKNLKSSKVSLKSKRSDQVLTVEFEGFPYLGIWAKPKAPYVCIEPWLGIADSVNSDRNLENKEGILRLGSRREFKAFYRIKIKE